MYDRCVEKKWWIGFPTIFLLGLVWIPLVFAQDVKWVTVDGTALMASTAAGDKAEARSQAIKAAEGNALTEALAKELSLESLLVNLRLSGGFVEAIPHGKIVSMEILDEGPVKSKNSEEATYRVRIKAGVVRKSGGKDPSFSLDATINQPVFKDGDELEIRIRSTQDCFLAIYNILEDKKVIRLHPNYLSNKNSVAAGEDLIFPSLGNKDSALKLLLHLPEKKDAVTEYIYIIAITRPFKFEQLKVQEGIFGVYNGQTAFMKELIREIVGIPLESRAEFLMQYEIRKK